MPGLCYGFVVGLGTQENVAMSRGIRRLVRFIMAGALMAAQGGVFAAPNPTALVKEALHHWRGDSSYTEVTMTIHRPDWQRRMEMIAWTKGRDDSLVRFTAPQGDAGNATLKLGQALWVYNPKLNQVIKLPFSMMAQNWMGSDFSYNDLAKSNQVVTDYTHTLAGSEQAAGHTVYTVVCMPRPSAPVIWGKQVLKIRDDGVLVEESFYDQDMKPVRRLETTKIGPLGGRPYPVTMRMVEVDKPGRWTQLHYTKGAFDLNLPAYLMTLSNLRNPRPWSAP
jgi:outer membrane lipoprotein-sorting protein